MFAVIISDRYGPNMDDVGVLSSCITRIALLMAPGLVLALGW